MRSSVLLRIRTYADDAGQTNGKSFKRTSTSNAHACRTIVEPLPSYRREVGDILINGSVSKPRAISMSF